MDIRICEKIALTPKEAGAMTNIGECEIRRLCASGDIMATRVGREWKIPRKLLDEFVTEKARKGEPI